MKVLKKFQNVPVNVKVEGERKMLRDVMLVPTNTTGVFALRTGSRGRPRLVGASEIEKITVLDGSASKVKPVEKKKSAAKKTTKREVEVEQPVKKRKIVVVRKSSK